jgi:alcohol dehydrogenase (cytochrome c)
MAGLLSTAGALVFGGAEEGNFFALDAETGKSLWNLQLGAAVRANPVSFSINGKQQVAIAAGSSLFVFGLP